MEMSTLENWLWDAACCIRGPIQIRLCFDFNHILYSNSSIKSLEIEDKYIFEFLKKYFGHAIL